NLDRKLDTLTTKEKYLDDYDAKLKEREQQVETREQELTGLIEQYNKLVTDMQSQSKQELLRISNLAEEDARKEALKLVERENQHEAAQIIQRNMERAEEEAKEHARKITLQAIQRYASEHTADSTVSTVAIPSDDMKGRVIGREGRNIRAFELMTGVNLIVDDTPEAVLISSFDPFRREIAKIALERLVADGRIHPARIEEVVEAVRNEMDEQVVQEGTDAAAEAGVHDLSPELNRLLGMLKFRTSYGQNVLRHSVEVATIAGIMAAELGADEEVARRGGLLHDIGKAVDHETEGTHLTIGIKLLRKFGEKEEVIQAMEAHHFDVEPATVEAVLVQAADALSAARPGARRDMLETYVQRLQKLEQIADSFAGVAKAYAIQAGRELRIIVESARVSDDESVWLSRDIANRIQREVQYPGEIKVTVIRETRAVEVAH
ncbi:MAG: ribonuclease Y, partial [Acidobacteriota bacterium]